MASRAYALSGSLRGATSAPKADMVFSQGKVAARSELNGVDGAASSDFNGNGRALRSGITSASGWFDKHLHIGHENSAQRRSVHVSAVRLRN